MDNIHTLVRDKVYDLALDVMDEANFEIIVHGEFTPDQFANADADRAELLDLMDTAWTLLKAEAK